MPTSVADFLLTISDVRRKESKTLIRIMSTISGKNPVMWGKSIIGFGSQNYQYESGHSGDTPMLSFSPRKTAITIYFIDGFDKYTLHLDQLGQYKLGKACLYISNFSQIKQDVLTAMLRQSYDHVTRPSSQDITVESYINHIPSITRHHFDQLRKIAKAELPDAKEVISYGIIGYKIDNKRARVFISGWKDHVAVYPVPKDAKLLQELASYQKGKGTLWFGLDKPLPTQLIKKVIRALVS